MPTTDPLVPAPLPDRTSGVGNDIAAIIDLIRGVQGTDIDNAREAASMADPYAQYRNERMRDLNAFLKDPSSLRNDPGYKFALNEGLDSVAAKGNSMFGTTRSGNTAIALEKFGTGFADQAYNTRLNQLMQLAGVNSGSPAAAAALLTKGPENRDRTVGGGLGGLTNLLTGKGGSAIMSGFKDILRMLQGGGTLDPNNISDSTRSLLEALGLNADDAVNLEDIFSGGGGSATDLISQILAGSGGGGSNPSLDLGDVSQSTGNLIQDLFGSDPASIFGP